MIFAAGLDARTTWRFGGRRRRNWAEKFSEEFALLEKGESHGGGWRDGFGKRNLAAVGVRGIEDEQRDPRGCQPRPSAAIRTDEFVPQHR